MKKNADGNGRAVTVGTFDGVHRGHKEVLRTLKGYSERNGLHPLVITFDRHPLETVAPARAPKLLQSREERDELIRGTGVEVEEVAFTPTLCALTAGEWMEILRERYDAKALITGYDNKFGSDGRGLTPSDYRRLGEERGLIVETAGELPGVCSTFIRRALERGDVKEATEMLGREYVLKGEVVNGRHLGRKLGFPTANLDISRRMLLPGKGVYAARLEGMPAVVNIGDNPTIESGNPVTVEAHVIGFEGDLYGKVVKLSFVDRIRNEEKFDSLDSLREQIERDKEEAERILGT